MKPVGSSGGCTIACREISGEDCWGWLFAAPNEETYIANVCPLVFAPPVPVTVIGWMVADGAVTQSGPGNAEIHGLAGAPPWGDGGGAGHVFTVLSQT